jgi:hypothetical protein
MVYEEMGGKSRIFSRLFGREPPASAALRSANKLAPGRHILCLRATEDGQPEGSDALLAVDVKPDG